MDEICKQLESEWETRLCNDVKHAQEQKQDCERHKITMYHEMCECEKYYNRYYKITIRITYNTIDEWVVTYDIYFDIDNTPPFNDREAYWIKSDRCKKTLNLILHASFLDYEHEKVIQNVIMRYRKRYVDNVLLEICIVTLLELYANTHFHDLRNIERILADDFLVKMILSKN